MAGTGGRTTTQGYSEADGVRQKFTDKERDSETGLDYFLARYYSSMQGRFTSPDEFTGGPDELYYFVDDAAANPIFYADLRKPQSLNKYQYGFNNPLRYVDPDGHDPEETLDPPQQPQAPKPIPYGLQPYDPQKQKERLDGNEAQYKCDHGDCSGLDKMMPPVEIPPLVTPVPVAPQKQPSPTAAKKTDSTPERERSPYPPAKRRRFNTKKGAEDAARRDGNGNDPVNHPNDKHGPHFHPGDGKGKPLNHDHYFYPKHRGTPKKTPDKE